MRHRLVAVGLALAGVWFGGIRDARALKGWPADSPGEERNPGMFDVAGDVVTPHTPWAKPHALGKLKVLFIIPRWTGREVVELAQRVAMDYTVAVVGSRKALSSAKPGSVRLGYAGERASAVLARLRKRLQGTYDLIVVGNVHATTLPDDVWQTIRAKVGAGTGLLVCPGQPDAPVIAAMRRAGSAKDLPHSLGVVVPYSELPAFGPTDKRASIPVPPAGLFRLGKGHVLLVAYDPGQGGSFLTPRLTVTQARQFGTAYDYYQSLAAKLLLTAAGRTARTSVVSVTVSPVVVDRTGADKGMVSVRLRGAARALGGRVRLRVRHAQGHCQHEQTAAVTPVVGFRSPGKGLPAGHYFADVWVLDKQGRVLDWASAGFRVFDEQGIADLRIPPAIRHGQPIRGSLKLKRPLGKDERLVLDVTDFFGRVTSRQELKPGDKTDAKFTIGVGPVLSLVAHLRVSVYRGKELVERRDTAVGLSKPGTGPGWDDFSFMVWSFVDEHLHDLAVKQLCNAGCDRLLTAAWHRWPEHERQATLVADRHNCRAYPYAWWVGNLWNMNRPEMRYRFSQLAVRLPRYGCDTYSMGDECHLKGEGGGQITWDEMRRDFHRELKTQYKDLGALNKEWNTQFKSWDDVKGITLEDARKQNQLARWADHRMHIETYFAEFFGEARRLVQKQHKTGRVGFEGAFGVDSYRAYDWWKLMKNINLMGNYWFTPMAWEMIGSFKPPDMYWGFWNGSYVDVSNRWCQGWVAWRCLMHGMNSVWYWAPRFHSDSDCAFGVYYPDLRVNPAVAPFLDAVREIKRGPGKLLLTSQRVYPGVGIHFSQASVHANTIDDAGFKSPGAGCPMRIQASWMNVAWSLKEIGIQARFVSYEQVARGEFKGCRVLILPFSQAISRQECAALRTFVADGGALIADVRPAVCDGHCKRQPKGLLDDLFGIARTGDKPPAPAADLKIDCLGVSGVLPGCQVDPNVKATTGKALAHTPEGVPLFIERRTGKGRTLLLNFTGHYTPGSYGKTRVPAVRTAPRGDTYLRLAAALAALGGVRPELSVKVGKAPLRGVDIVTWHNGPNAYYGFTPNDYCDFAWVITMPMTQELSATTTQPGHFYDVRSGTYLGHGTQFKVTLERGSAALVARLPYRVTGVRLKPPATAKPGQGVRIDMTVVTNGPGAGHHVLRVDVLGPEGKERRHYGANVLCRKGSGRYALPLALNDPAGTWTVRVRDVATGATAQAALNVK